MDKAIFVIADTARKKKNSARDGHWHKIIVYIHEINILPKHAIVFNVMNAFEINAKAANSLSNEKCPERTK